jgi:hypothetical protein
VRFVWLCALVACGGSPAPKPVEEPPPKKTGPSAQELRAAEQKQHDEIVAKHREHEAEAQDAFAAKCDDPKSAKPRCEPSCYQNEPKDPREGKKLNGAAEIQHLVCENKLDTDFGPPMISDELEPKLKVTPFARRFPSPHKKGWQADVEASFKDKLAKGDVLVITGNWRDVTNPLTHEALRCAAATQYTRVLKGKLDACGGSGKLACEAGGNAVAHAIDVVHFRVAEARALAAAKDEDKCRQAALEAIAVARGLPRWRQYKKLNVHEWTDGLTYKTRFDGILDEDSLFAATTELGTEAESVYASCGGEVNVKTKPEQEQSFHGCF